MAPLYSLTKISALFDHYSPLSSLILQALRDWLQIIGWEFPKMLGTWVEILKDIVGGAGNQWAN